MNSTEIVKTLLKEEGWTQAKLCQELGYSSTGTLTRKFSQGNMTFETMKMMLDAMGYEMVIRKTGSKEDSIVV